MMMYKDVVLPLRILILFYKIIEKVEKSDDIIFVPYQLLISMELSEDDMQVLMKITLLTPTNKKVNIILPFIKKFCPKIALEQNISTYIPLIQKIELQVIHQSSKEIASIDLQLIIEHPSHEHIVNVQTYASQSKKMGSKYAFHLQFAQTIVNSTEPNSLSIKFKTIALILAIKTVIKPYVRVILSHGSSWSGQPVAASQTIKYNQQTSLVFRSLLDTITFQICSERERLCETKRFIFQLLGQQSHIFELEGRNIKSAKIKISAKPVIPIVMIE